MIFKKLAEIYIKETGIESSGAILDFARWLEKQEGRKLDDKDKCSNCKAKMPENMICYDYMSSCYCIKCGQRYD